MQFSWDVLGKDISQVMLCAPQHWWYLMSGCPTLVMLSLVTGLKRWQPALSIIKVRWEAVCRVGLCRHASILFPTASPNGFSVHRWINCFIDGCKMVILLILSLLPHLLNVLFFFFCKDELSLINCGWARVLPNIRVYMIHLFFLIAGFHNKVLA